MTNSRRRFLGLLGLFGLPSSVWAQTAEPAGPPQIVCEALLQATKDGYNVNYRRLYELVDGRLTPFADNDSSSVDLAPTKAQYADGYSSGGTLGDISDGVSFDAPQFTITSPTLSGFAGRFSMYLVSETKLTAVTVVLVTKSAKTACTSGTFNVGSDGKTYNIVGFWTPTTSEVLGGLFEVAIYVGQDLIAVFDFDASRVNYAELIAAKDREVLAASDLVLDAETGAIEGLDDCKLNDGSDCFFTTAAVGTLGLSDDCWELQTLRAFRDGPLRRTESGRALSVRYYNEAPRLVAGINERGDAAAIWLNSYWCYIVPCAVMARLGLGSPAVAHYRRLFKRLESLA